MLRRYFGLFLLVFMSNILLAKVSYAQLNKDEKHVQVAMRLIGHEVLLLAGDSVSRILPIEKEAGRYKISFASDFLFNPNELVFTIDQVVKQTRIAKSYRVEIEQCLSGKIVHSFEKGDVPQNDVMACGTRLPEKDCYVIYFTILDKRQSLASLYMNFPKGYRTSTGIQNPGLATLFIVIFFVLAFIIYSIIKKRRLAHAAKTVFSKEADLILIGSCRFDPRNMLLFYAGKSTQLSGKEADLLSLLFKYRNETIQKEKILKIVWGDEGDYVGRTLDVFISKLRKKLELDPAVKILNIRGVGYKLVVN